MPALLSQPPPDISYSEYVTLQVQRSLVNVAYDPGPRCRNLLAVLRRFLPPSADARVLAVGCRNTYELDYILAAGYGSVTGIDLRAEDPRIQRMDMQAMTFPDNCFDAVYSCHSLEHALDPRRAGLEFERVLRPRGVAIIEVPIHVKREKGDLWDFRDAETVASLLGGRLLWSETGQQVTAPQKVVRALVRVKDS